MTHQHQRFGQRKLALPEKAKRRLDRLTGVAGIDRNDQQIVEPGLVIGPHVLDLAPHEADQRSQRQLRGVSQITVFLWWPADDSCRVYGVFPPGDTLYFKHRVIGCLRVVTEVVAKRAFQASYPWFHEAFEHKFGLCRHFQVDGLGLCQRCTFSPHDTGKSDFIDALGQWHYRGEDQRRVTAYGHCHFERSAHLLGDLIVEAPTLLDLHVHTGGALVVHLHPVYTHVPGPGLRITGNHQWQRDKPASIFRPALQNRELVEPGFFHDLLGDRAACAGRSRLSPF